MFDFIKEIVDRRLAIFIAGILVGVSLMLWLESYLGMVMITKLSYEQLVRTSDSFGKENEKLVKENERLRTESAAYSSRVNGVEGELSSCIEENNNNGKSVSDLKKELFQVREESQKWFTNKNLQISSLERENSLLKQKESRVSQRERLERDNDGSNIDSSKTNISRKTNGVQGVQENTVPKVNPRVVSKVHLFYGHKTDVCGSTSVRANKYINDITALAAINTEVKEISLGNAISIKCTDGSDSIIRVIEIDKDHIVLSVEK